MRPIVLSVAGSDSCGGAGIQADLKAIEANGGYAASVLTAITAQNTRHVVYAETLSAELVTAQLDAVFEDLTVSAVKTGMLGNAAIVRCVAQRLARANYGVLVCDPVLRAGSGATLLSQAGRESLRELLFPLAQLVTPNAEEAAFLVGSPVETLEQARQAGEQILSWGPGAVLVKGGHLSTAEATDVLVTPTGSTCLSGERLDTAHGHGTGCVLSAAIATRLARGEPLLQAVKYAKRFVSAVLRNALPIGRDAGPVDPLFLLHQAGLERGELLPAGEGDS